MEADRKQADAIRLSKMIQGVGEGRDASDEEVVDLLLKMEGRATFLARWAEAALSFFLPVVTPSIKSAKPIPQTRSSQSDFPVARGAV